MFFSSRSLLLVVTFAASSSCVYANNFGDYNVDVNAGQPEESGFVRSAFGTLGRGVTNARQAVMNSWVRKHVEPGILDASQERIEIAPVTPSKNEVDILKAIKIEDAKRALEGKPSMARATLEEVRAAFGSFFSNIKEMHFSPELKLGVGITCVAATIGYILYRSGKFGEWKDDAIETLSPRLEKVTSYIKTHKKQCIAACVALGLAAFAGKTAYAYCPAFEGNGLTQKIQDLYAGLLSKVWAKEQSIIAAQ